MNPKTSQENTPIEIYRYLVENSPDPMIIHNGKEIVFANDLFAQLIDFPIRELIGKPFLAFFDPNDRETITTHMVDEISVNPLEVKIVSRSNASIDVEITGVSLTYDDMPTFLIRVRDISEQVRMRITSQLNEQRHQSLFDYNPNVVYSMNRDGIITNINKAAEEVLGYPKADLVQTSIYDVIEWNDVDAVHDMICAALAGKPQSYDIVAIHKSGSRVQLTLTKIPIIVNGEIIGVYGVAKDISNEKEALQKIEKLAYRDQLTGLPNRHWFFNELISTIGLSVGEDNEIALLMMDFDNFKKINDTLGHLAGDIFLQKVSDRLRGCLRKDDGLARFGGDEFIVLLRNTNEDDIHKITKRIVQEMNRPFVILGREINMTMSIGISFYSEEKDIDELVNQADFALYSVKETGKNNYQIYTEEIHARYNRRQQINKALSKAINQQELKLDYQPQVHLRTGDLVGFEALLRWEPSFGIVSPNEFIPIAEENGLIVPIGTWVLREACRQMKEWEEQGYPKVRVSVNVSASQLKHPSFITSVREIVREQQVDPRLIELEITESVLMEVDESQHVVQGLKDLGIAIAIDDFGEGYSSLSIISQVAFDTIKIDKSLIQGNILSDRKATFLKAIISAGKALGSNIVVEGIELEEQKTLLKTFDVTGQGYYFSRPVPANLIRGIWK